MSECVVRMEMPEDKNCLLNFSLPKIGPWCWIEDRACDYYKTNNRPDWCPIICSLPEGHGPLVDMNDVEGMFEAAQIISDDDCNCGYVTDDLRIEELPTLVPAERSET